MHVCERECIFYLVRESACECSHWAQCCGGPLLHLIPPHFSSLVSETLATCTSSTLQKPRRQEEGSPLLLNISPFPFFVFLRNSSTPLALLSTAHPIRSEHLQRDSPPYGLAHGEPDAFQWAAAPLTRDLLSGYLHNPHGSTPQPPGGTASCGEHLFNLSSS